MTADMGYRPQVDGNAARAVRALMSWHDLTQQDVAGSTGLSDDTLGRRLSSKGKVGRDFKAHEIELLAWYFGRPISEFYSGKVNVGESYLPGDGRRDERQISAYLTPEMSGLIAA
jgi:transcriptional regulator with XRE-family HTH domain